MKSKIIQLKQPYKTCICVACDAPKPKLSTGTHRLKVQQKYTGNNYNYVPSLLLAGKWLDKKGFNHYTTVTSPKYKLSEFLERSSAVNATYTW